MKKINQIQFLRAIASLAVVVRHIPFVGRGEFGVDLFFVISGFIIVYVTEKSTRHFLRKRVVRIVPLYWLGTIMLFLIASLWPDLLKSTQANPRYLIESLFFWPSVYEMTYKPPILILGWSLCYEMLFYLIFWVSLLISHRNRVWIAGALLVLLVSVHPETQFANPRFWFWTNPMILEFVFGMITAWLWLRYADRLPKLNLLQARLLFVAGLAVFGLLFLMPENYMRALRWGVPCWAMFVLVLWAGTRLSFGRWSTRLGDASYSLYLFHPYVVLGVSRSVFPLEELNAATIAVALMVVGLCVVLSLLLWRFVEDPLNRWLRLRLATDR